MIFSTVDALVETVGRSRSSTYADLDTLTAIWTGPTALADTVPKIGSTHPEYPGLECRAQHKIADVANITRIQLDYCGLFSGGTIGIVAKGFTSQVGELQYQEPFDVPTGYGVSSYVTTGSQVVQQEIVFMKYGLQTFIGTYISRNWTYRYCAKNASKPRFSGGDILSITTRSGGQSSVTYGQVPAGQGGAALSQMYPGVLFGYSTEVFCSSFTAEPMSPSWFRCTEVWSARLVQGAGG